MTHRQMVGDRWVRYHYQSPTLHSYSCIVQLLLHSCFDKTNTDASVELTAFRPCGRLPPACLAALSPVGRGRDHHYVCIRRQPRVPSSFLFPWIKVADIFPAPHAFIRSQPCLQKRPSLSLPNCCQYLPAPSSRSSLPPFLPHQCVLDHKPWPICSQDLSVLFCAPRAICN